MIATVYFFVSTFVMVWRTRGVIVIDRINVPGSFIQAGYDREVFRTTVLREIANIKRVLAAPDTVPREEELSNPGSSVTSQDNRSVSAEEMIARKAHTITEISPVEDLPQFDIPETGLSIRSFARWIQNESPWKPTHVSADLTSEGSRQDQSQLMKLTLMISQGESQPESRKPITVVAEDPGKMAAVVAQKVLRETDPYVLAAYIHRSERYSTSEALGLLGGKIPENAEFVKLLKANLLAKRSDEEFKEAETLYNEIVAERPGVMHWIKERLTTPSLDELKAAAYLSWGNALVHQENADPRIYLQAAEKYQKSAEYNPDNAAIYNNWGIALDKLGNSLEAIAKFRKAIDLANHNYPAAYNNLAVAQTHQGDTQDAVKNLETATNLYPNYAVAFINTGDALLEMGKTNEAIVAYQKAVALRPDDYFANMGLGKAFAKLGQLDMSFPAYQKAFSFGSWQSFGDLYVNLGNAFDRFIDFAFRKKDKADIYYKAGSLLRRKGNTVEAISALRTSIKLSPQNTAAYSLLGDLLSDQGRVADAIASYGKAIQLGSQDIYTYQHLASVLEKSGRIQEANQILKKAPKSM